MISIESNQKDSSQLKSVRYKILGNPIALQRARHGNGKTWDNQKHLKLNYGIDLANQHDRRSFLTGPLHVDITFYMEMPQRSAAKRKELVGKYHIFRPDISNLLKFAEDSATGILFHDDCLIASIVCKKIYDEVPRTEFMITELR